MSKEKIIEILGKQLNLLSEYSHNCCERELAEITQAMIRLSELLLASL